MIYKINNKKKVDANLALAIKIFNDNKIFYWICHGTLLGIIRDKKLIEWDHDIDIAVWQHDNKRKLIIDTMFKNNFKIKKKFMASEDLLTFTRYGGREVDINFYQIRKKNYKKIAYSNWYIPKNLFMKLIDALSHSKTYMGNFKFLIRSLSMFDFVFESLKFYFIKKKLFYRKAGYTLPRSLLNRFEFVYFNRLKLRIPKKHKECLKLIYGKDWKIPNKNYNWIKDSPSTIKY